MELRKLTTVEEMLPHIHLVQQLTASLRPTDYERLLQRMLPHNYAMIAAFEGETCLGLSGYWIGHKLYCGKYLEIDNFIVDASARSRGVGKALLNRMEELAREQGCDTLMLDAFRTNTNAHRFYQRHGLKPLGYHFIKKL